MKENKLYKFKKDEGALRNPFSIQSRNSLSRGKKLSHKSYIKLSKKTKTLNRIAKIRRYLLVLNKHIVFKEDFKLDIIFMTNEFRRLFETRGLKFAITRFKESRLCFTKSLCLQPITIDGLPCNQLGVPTWLQGHVNPSMSNIEVRS